jgi:manganese/zinc/iron transport system permease protein
MSAMLIAPGVAARQWTNRLSVMVLLAGFFGAASGFIGTFISSSISNMPTGPTIVIVISLFVIISLFFAPQRGLVWKYIRMMRNHQNLSEDRLLFNLYNLAINHENRLHSHPIDVIKPLESRKNNKRINGLLNELAGKGYVVNEYADRWALTEEGFNYVKNHPMKGGL